MNESRTADGSFGGAAGKMCCLFDGGDTPWHGMYDHIPAYIDVQRFFSKSGTVGFLHGVYVRKWICVRLQR